MPRTMTMAKPSIRQRMKAQKRMIDAQAQAAGELLAEKELAIAILLKRLGGAVTVTAPEIEAVVGGRVAVTKAEDGVKWELVGTNEEVTAKE